MSLTIKNKNSYELGNNLTEYFKISLEESKSPDEYSRLKDDIYALDIDNEDKVNILNKINSLNTTISSSQKKKIIKEIEKFKNDNNI